MGGLALTAPWLLDRWVTKTLATVARTHGVTIETDGLRVTGLKATLADLRVSGPRFELRCAAAEVPITALGLRATRDVSLEECSATLVSVGAESREASGQPPSSPFSATRTGITSVLDACANLRTIVDTISLDRLVVSVSERTSFELRNIRLSTGSSSLAVHGELRDERHQDPHALFTVVVDDDSASIESEALTRVGPVLMGFRRLTLHRTEGAALAGLRLEEPGWGSAHLADVRHPLTDAGVLTIDGGEVAPDSRLLATIRAVFAPPEVRLFSPSPMHATRRHARPRPVAGRLLAVIESAPARLLALHSALDVVSTRSPVDVRLRGITLQQAAGCEGGTVSVDVTRGGALAARLTCREATLSADRSDDGSTIQLAATGIDLGAFSRWLGLGETLSGAIDLNFGVTTIDGLHEATASFELLHGRVHSEPISGHPVELPLVTATLSGRIGGADDLVLDASATLQFGDAALDGTLNVARADGHAIISAEGGLTETTDCALIWESLPSGLVPNLAPANIRFTGAARPRLQTRYTVGTPESFDLRQTGFIGDCTVEITRGQFDPSRLNDDGTVFIVTEGVSAPLQVGPGTPSYTPLREIPAFVPAVMYLSEEMAFFSNPGFSLNLMRRAIRMNIRDGRYVYGGSTVSQQLVKNLFFDRQKTLSRKLEEAIVVWAMESVVSKERILELYLNCIEFGTDVYGIEAASEFYFGTRAESLTPLQAAFLAALKPAPWEAMRHWTRGTTPSTGWWPERLEQLLWRLVEAGELIESEEVGHYAPFVVVFPTSPNYTKQLGPTLARPPGTSWMSLVDVRSQLAPLQP